MTELYRYAAFISYSSKDAVFAQRLHKALERYSIPASLGKFDLIGGGKKNRIYPVFRDREELSAGSLGERIEAALKASATLIVVCSPNAAESPWVEKEIQFFKSLGRSDRIFAIIAKEAPLTDEAGRDATIWSLPNALRGNTLACPSALEPLAADARKSKDGFRNAWLKLIAGIIGVTPGQLNDRDTKRRRDRWIGYTAFTLLILACSAVGFAFRAEVDRANSLLAEAERLIALGDHVSAVKFAVAASPDSSMLRSILPQQSFDRALADSGFATRAVWVEKSPFAGTKWEIAPSGKYLYTQNENNIGTVIDLLTKRSVRLPGVIQGSLFLKDSCCFLFRNENSFQRVSLVEGDLSLSPIGSVGDVRYSFVDRVSDRVVVIEDDLSCDLWDARSGQLMAALAPPATCEAVSIDERSITIRAPDRKDLIFDRNGNPILQEYQISCEHCGAPQNGSILYSATGNIVDIFDVSAQTRLGTIELPAAHKTLFFDSESYSLSSVDTSGALSIYDTRSLRELFHLPNEQFKSYKNLAGRAILLWSEDDSGMLIDLPSGQLTRRFGPGEIGEFTFSREAAVLATVSSDERRVQLIDTRDGTILSSISPGGRLSLSVFDLNQKLLSVDSIDERGFIWDLGRNREILEFPRSNYDDGPASAFSFDGQFFLASRSDGSATLWNVRDGTIAASWGSFGVVEAAFAAEANRLVTVSALSQVVVWELGGAQHQDGEPIRNRVCRLNREMIPEFSEEEVLRWRLGRRSQHPCDWRGVLIKQK